MLRLGIDIGSVTAKLALLEGERVLDARVLRTQGRPAETLRRLLAEALEQHGDVAVVVVATGSGKSLVPDPAGRVSEILAHARSAARFHPRVRVVLEIGGQDAKMIWLPGTGEPRILDHALNDLCAAGTGAFLDQQAARLGLDAAELGRLAASSTSPATVATIEHVRLITHAKGGNQANIRIVTTALFTNDGSSRVGVWNGTMSGTYNNEQMATGTISDVTRKTTSGRWGFPESGRVDADFPNWKYEITYQGGGTATAYVTNKNRDKVTEVNISVQ